jgi:hypothetical protein
VAHKSLAGLGLPISLALLTSSRFGDMRDRQSKGKESTSETIEWLLTGLRASKRVQNGCMQNLFRDLHTSVLSRRSGNSMWDQVKWGRSHICSEKRNEDF